MLSEVLIKRSYHFEGLDKPMRFNELRRVVVPVLEVDIDYWMIDKMRTNTRQVFDHWDFEFFQLFGRTNA